jgi:hypothetical protein
MKKLTRKKELVKEIYKIFADTIEEKQFNDLLNEIEADKKRTEGAIVDLFFCYFIIKGLEQKHLTLLSERLGHKQFRANHLSERLNYLTYIVKQITGKEDIKLNENVLTSLIK